MSLSDKLKSDPVDVRDAIKAAGWLQRNMPRLWRWVQYWRGKTGVLLVCALAVTLTAGTCVRAIGNLPEIPEPPRPTPKPVALSIAGQP